MTPRWIERLRLDLNERLAERAASAAPSSPEGGRWLLRWAGVCALVLATLYLACGYHAGFLRLNAFAAGYPPVLWEYLTTLGDERVAFALALLFSLRHPRLFWSLALAALIAVVYSRGLKELFDSARPPAILAADAFHLIGPAHRHASFPSGHSVTAGVFFGVLVYQARLSEWRSLLLLIAVLVGLSRVAVGVHWPVDVAAGLMGGALAAWFGTRLAARWPGPATDLRVHLGLVALLVVLALGLLWGDGGYPGAAWMRRCVGVLALLSAAGHYLVWPLIRPVQIR